MFHALLSLRLFWRWLRTGSVISLENADVQKPLNQYTAYITYLYQVHGEDFTRLAQQAAFFIERHQGTLIALAFLRAVTNGLEDVEEFIATYGPQEVGLLEEYHQTQMELTERMLAGEFPSDTLEKETVSLLKTEITGTSELALAELKDRLRQKPASPRFSEPPSR